MKHSAIFFLLISGIYVHLQARIGCRDNSWHMQKKYDYKQDHAVTCLCPCPEKMGRCQQCRHYHEAQPWVIIKNNSSKNLPKKNLFNQNIQSVFKKLITQYHQQQSSKSNKLNRY